MVQGWFRAQRFRAALTIATTMFALRAIAFCSMTAFLGACETRKAPTPSSTTADPPCPALAPLDSWRLITTDYFQAKLPASFDQTPVSKGIGFRDPTGPRIRFSNVDWPAESGNTPQALDILVDGVRREASDAGLSLTLGPVLERGTPQRPSRLFSVTSPNLNVVQGIVAQRIHSQFMAISFTLEQESSQTSAKCLEIMATQVIDTIELRPSPALAASTPPADTPLLRLTPAAVQELNHQLEHGEVVWLGANREGNEVSFLLDVGREIPPNSRRMHIDGIAFAIDRGSEPMVRGVTIDFAPGQGFAFHRP